MLFKKNCQTLHKASKTKSNCTYFVCEWIPHPTFLHMQPNPIEAMTTSEVPCITVKYFHKIKVSIWPTSSNQIFSSNFYSSHSLILPFFHIFFLFQSLFPVFPSFFVQFLPSFKIPLLLTLISVLLFLFKFCFISHLCFFIFFNFLPLSLYSFLHIQIPPIYIGLIWRSTTGANAS